ncbi:MULTISPECIES: STM2901 family protein [Pseudomonas syringae group]|uniref:STM2901 family protein n=1 Tax=Pseudomonas syringae group TaxID=136849 RepID=UPI0009F9DACE|nr:hypothetical protein F4W67_28135 [Pseudomonas caricapapayae]
MARIYCYDGDGGYTANHLLWVIAIEVTMEELGIDDAAAAFAVVIGSNVIPTRGKFANAVSGTSVISLVLRRLLRGKTFPKGQRWPTIVGYWPKIRWTKSVGAFIARAVPVLGWTYTATQLGIVGYKTVTVYNSIVDPSDQVF